MRSLLQPQGQPAGAASARRLGLHQTIDDYMEDDASYLPNDKDLNDLKSEILQHIVYSVEVLLKEATAEDQGEPQFSLSAKYERGPLLFEALKSKTFFQLCQPIFGSSTQTDAHEKAYQLQLHMKDFLRSFIGAAVCNWVCVGCDDKFPTLPGKSHDTDPATAFTYQRAVEAGESLSWLIASALTTFRLTTDTLMASVSRTSRDDCT